MDYNKTAFQKRDRSRQGDKSRHHRQATTARLPEAVLGGEGAVVAIRRKDRLNSFLQNSGRSIDSLAELLMLTAPRLRDILSGKVFISNELATHIEEMLNLPASGLDGNHPSDISNIPQMASSTSYPLPIATVTEKNAMNVMTQKNITEEDPNPRVSSRRKNNAQVIEYRKENLCNLTSQRGSKNALSALAGFNSSRISLMTSGRKPVSDPFALAIEDCLGLPRGWLDDTHNTADIPEDVWRRLGIKPIASANISEASKPSREKSADCLPKVISAAREKSPALSTRAAAAFGELEKPANVPDAGELPLTSPVFDKSIGEVGPIASALAKTIIRLSEMDQLSERRAFQLLGILLGDSAKI